MSSSENHSESDEECPENTPTDDALENDIDDRDWTNPRDTDIFLPGSVDRLEEGIMWERLLMNKIEERILDHHMETLRDSCTSIEYDKNPQVQKAGIDGAFGGYDLKTRKNYAFSEANPDVYIEIDSERDDVTSWGFNESSVFVPYCWENDSRTNIRESVMIIKKDGFNEWLDRVSDNYEDRQSGSTTAIPVPVSNIPEPYIDKYINLTMETDLPEPIDEFIKHERAVNDFLEE